MSRDSYSGQSIEGTLGIEPALAWHEFKDTSHLPMAYWGLVNRHAGFSSTCALKIRDLFVEDKDAFVKIAEVVEVKADSWSMDMRTVIRDIEEMIEAFPGHSFSGRIWHRHDEQVLGKLEVNGNQITWLEPTRVWVLHSEPAQEQAPSRWEAGKGWINDDLRFRLGRANTMLATLLEMTKRVTKDEEHAALHRDGERCPDETCLLNLIEQHLSREAYRP